MSNITLVAILDVKIRFIFCQHTHTFTEKAENSYITYLISNLDNRSTINQRLNCCSNAKVVTLYRALPNHYSKPEIA